MNYEKISDTMRQMFMFAKKFIRKATEQDELDRPNPDKH